MTVERLHAFAAGAGPAERLWWWSTVGFLAVFAVLLVVQRFDPRLIGAESVWAKPLKFALATKVHFAAIALAVHFLRPAWSGSGWMTALAAFSILAAVFEVAYIALQGGRGLPSHFNVSTPGYAALWSLMAAAAVVVLAPMGVVGVLAALDGEARWPLAVRLGVALGMAGGAALTLVTAFRLGANMSHFVGLPPAADRAVPLLGWSLRGADLRPAHFFATHMAHVVPLAALTLAALLPPRVATLLAASFAAGWAGLTWLVFTNALAGRSLAGLLKL